MLASSRSTRLALASQTPRAPRPALQPPSSRRRVRVAAAPLIERLGGPDAVTAAVDIFYGKVLADDRVKHYFDSTDMAKQRKHQAAFMTYAFGGAANYKGKDMVEAHRHLIPHLEESHFNAIVENFIATLKELGVSQADIDDAVAIVATTKEQVLAD